MSSRKLIIKFIFVKVKVCEYVSYGPSKDIIEKRETFWSNLY